MKKVFFAMMLLAATLTLSAQVTVTRLETTTSNPAYSVPDYIRVNFQTTYPTVTTVEWAPVHEVWAPSSEMWRAVYTENNRVTRVYYDQRGNTYSVALPVISNFVPEDVVTSAIKMYGTSLYDITMMKAADNTDVYQVRLLENNVPKSVWMDEMGVVVTRDVYKVKVDGDEIKIKADDEMKIKQENQ